MLARHQMMSEVKDLLYQSCNRTCLLMGGLKSKPRFTAAWSSWQSAPTVTSPSHCNLNLCRIKGTIWATQTVRTGSITEDLRRFSSVLPHTWAASLDPWGNGKPWCSWSWTGDRRFGFFWRSEGTGSSSSPSGDLRELDRVGRCHRGWHPAKRFGWSSNLNL